MDHSKTLSKKTFRVLLHAVSVGVCFLIMTACNFSNPFESGKKKTSSTLYDATPVDKYWLSKSVRLLRGGLELNSKDDPQQLLALSKDEVIDQLMSDKRFAEMVLDFNLYFLGFKPANIRSNNFGGFPYVDDIFAKPQAIASSIAVMNDGDYFSLFAAKTPRYLQANIFEPYKDSLPDSYQDNYPDSADVFTRRKFILDQASAESKKIAAILGKYLNGSQTIDGVCAEADGKITDLQTALFVVGVSSVISDYLGEGFDQVGISCFLKTAVSTTAVASIEAFPLRAALVLAQIERLEPANYAVNSIVDLQSMASVGITDIETSGFTVSGFWQNFANSSTNYNRRRAAYMLKTYFCDDLTPINIAISENTNMHSENKHASDPGCRGCHYKLDPMAGFFRNNGASGINDFGEKDSLVFDDLSRISGAGFTKYMENWKAAAQSGREWEVGYVRNANKPARNSYGESLEDLMTIIKTAPEVKTCLVRRLAEYTLGTEQIFDQAWLDELTTNFKTAPNSSAAFKKIVRELVKSKTFAVRDPDPNVCYDEVGDIASLAVPCAVRSIINKNCASCHNSTDDTRLDLTKWADIPGGAPSFAHLDSSNNQLDLINSMTRIKARLESRDPDGSNPLGSDPSMQMPPGGGRLSDPEKQILFKWLEQRINGIGG